jgi:ABC-type dipeptide/oligopeptide/nickel transport system ATPase component
MVFFSSKGTCKRRKKTLLRARRCMEQQHFHCWSQSQLYIAALQSWSLKKSHHFPCWRQNRIEMYEFFEFFTIEDKGWVLEMDPHHFSIRMLRRIHIKMMQFCNTVKVLHLGVEHQKNNSPNPNLHNFSLG